MDYKWELGKCKMCEGEMVRETIVFTNPKRHVVEVWVCKRCGYTRKL